jgi:sulfite reductase (NADPH) hemoprotein beta-component
MRLHDIGLELIRQDGALGARVFVGGGMGRTPMIAPEINPFVKADDLLSYLEACLRVYNRYGRRDNIYKARIKILIHEIGADAYRRQVAAEFAHVKTLGIDPPLAELERIAAFFAPPAYDAPDVEPDRTDPDFAVWLDQNVKPHKQAGYAIVNISLKPIGGIPGDATSQQIDVMADLAEKYSYDELRVTHAQNIVLPYVAKRDLYAVWHALRDAALADANLDLISDIIACPGLDYCSLANARSIPVAQKIATRFADMDRQRDLGELKLKISGCINACGHHHAGHIGILGVDKKGVENYQLTFGGSGAEDVSIGKIIGPGFDEDGVVDAVEKATEVYKALREGDERFLDTYRRVGLAPFKEAIYG